MKINKTVLLAAFGLCAASANASWIISGNGGDVTTAPGHSGSYTFTILGSTDLIAGNYNLGTATFGSVPSVSNLTDISGASASTATLYGSFYYDPNTSSFIPDGNSTAVPNVQLTVSWYVPIGATPNPTGYSFNVFLPATSTAPNSNPVVDQVGNVIVIVPAPEPAQTLAGAMLLGCGGLIFAGRRLFKKQSA